MSNKKSTEKVVLEVPSEAVVKAPNKKIGKMRRTVKRVSKKSLIGKEYPFTPEMKTLYESRAKEMEFYLNTPKFISNLNNSIAKICKYEAAFTEAAEKAYPELQEYLCAVIGKDGEGRLVVHSKLASEKVKTRKKRASRKTSKAKSLKAAS